MNILVFTLILAAAAVRAHGADESPRTGVQSRVQVQAQVGGGKAAAEAADNTGDGTLHVGVQGSITVIGPDGVTHTHTFGGERNGAGPMPDVRRHVEKAFEAAGIELPEHVRDSLEQAFGNEGPIPKAPGEPQPVEAAAISDKLDRILERLEKLEAEIRALRNAKSESD